MISAILKNGKQIVGIDLFVMKKEYGQAFLEKIDFLLCNDFCLQIPQNTIPIFYKTGEISSDYQGIKDIFETVGYEIMGQKYEWKFEV